MKILIKCRKIIELEILNFVCAVVATLALQRKIHVASKELSFCFLVFSTVKGGGGAETSRTPTRFRPLPCNVLFFLRFTSSICVLFVHVDAFFASSDPHPLRISHSDPLCRLFVVARLKTHSSVFRNHLRSLTASFLIPIVFTRDSVLSFISS